MTNHSEAPTEVEHAWSEVGKALGRAVRLTIEMAGRSPALVSEPSEVLAYAHLPLTMKVEEAANLLGTSRSAVYEMIRRGDLFALRLGRRLIVPRRAIVELLEATPPP